jgi:hypothetical protein
VLAAVLTTACACSLDPFAELDPRRARDCVALLDIDAYWFGPTFGDRRAIVATASRQDFSNTDEPQLFGLLPAP